MASPPAPLQLDSSFIKGHSIDYVAVEEGVTVDPRVDKARLKGYDSLKALGTLRQRYTLLLTLIVVNRQDHSYPAYTRNQSSYFAPST